MKTTRLATVAGLAAAICVAMPLGAQQSNQPRHIGQQDHLDHGTDQRGQQDAWRSRDPQRDQFGQQGRRGEGRIFAIQDQQAEQRLAQLSQRLEQREQQMQQMCQRTQQQLRQAQQQQGEQKIDALTQAVQGVLQEHQILHAYLEELRTAITGDTGSMMPGRPEQRWQQRDQWQEDRFEQRDERFRQRDQWQEQRDDGQRDQRGQDPWGQRGQQDPFGQQQGREQVQREIRQILPARDAQWVVTQLESGRLTQQERQQIISVMTARGNVEESQARMMVERWERQLGQQHFGQQDQWGQQDRQQDRWGQQDEQWGTQQKSRQQIEQEIRQVVSPQEAQRIVRQLETGRMTQQERQRIIQTLTTSGNVDHRQAQMMVSRWERALGQEQQFGQQGQDPWGHQGQTGLQSGRQQVEQEVRQFLPPQEAQRIVRQLETGRLTPQERQQIIQTLTTRSNIEQRQAQTMVTRWERTLSQEQQFGQQPDPWGQQARRPGTEGRIFAIEDQRAEQQLQQVTRQLEQYERQLEQMHQRTQQQLRQAQQQQGEQKVDALMQVVQGLTQEHQILHRYLQELRTTITGDSTGTQRQWGVQDPWEQDKKDVDKKDVDKKDQEKFDKDNGIDWHKDMKEQTQPQRDPRR